MFGLYVLRHFSVLGMAVDECHALWRDFSERPSDDHERSCSAHAVQLHRRSNVILTGAPAPC